MKLIHIADLHISHKSELQHKAARSLAQLIDYCSINPIDGVIIAGDVWDSPQTFGSESGVKLGFDFLRAIAQKVKFVFVIKGNNAHDNPQSIALLHQLKHNIFAYEYNVALGIAFHDELKIADLLREEINFEPEIIIHGLPYPTKQNIFSSLNSNSIDVQNSNFIDIYERILIQHGLISDKYNGIPKITVFHGNVSGAKLSNGQTLIGQDIILPDAILRHTNANYYALGHIHLPQCVAADMYYSGSIYNKDFGEMEQKYFTVIDFQGEQYELEHIPFKSRPMVVIDAEFVNGELIYSNGLIPASAEIEIKFRIVVKENERALLTSKFFEDIKQKFGEDVKIETKIIPVERNARSENIIAVKTLVDEVVEYAKVVGEDITDGLLDKVRQLELQ